MSQSNNDDIFDEMVEIIQVLLIWGETHEKRWWPMDRRLVENARQLLKKAGS